MAASATFASHGAVQVKLVILKARSVNLPIRLVSEVRARSHETDAGTFVVHPANKRAPLTDEARDAVERGDVDTGEDAFEVLSPVEGLIVVSQSCDIVRECSKSECMEVSPLVFIENDGHVRQGGGKTG
jgi:hypothetical protein